MRDKRLVCRYRYLASDSYTTYLPVGFIFLMHTVIFIFKVVIPMSRLASFRQPRTHLNYCSKFYDIFEEFYQFFQEKLMQFLQDLGRNTEMATKFQQRA